MGGAFFTSVAAYYEEFGPVPAEKAIWLLREANGRPPSPRETA